MWIYQTLEYKVTEADRGGLNLQTAFVKENSYKTHQDFVSVPYKNLDLNVSLATVRDQLNPGGQETWTVNVKDYKDQPVKAALLAGMYDVSLDEFAYHHWYFNMSPYSGGSKSFRTDRSRFTSSSTGLYYLEGTKLFNFELPSDNPFFVVYTYRYGGYRMGRALRKAGGVVYEEMVLDECAAEPASVNGAMVEIAKQETALERLLSRQ